MDPRIIRLDWIHQQPSHQPLSSLLLPTRVPFYLVPCPGRVRAYAKTFFDKRAWITNRVIAASSHPSCDLSPRGGGIGRALDRKLERAKGTCFEQFPPLEQPIRAALRVTCCHASRGGDTSTWLFCKLTSAITVARRRNWRRKTRQLNSQSVRNFFPILSDFFSFPAGIGSFQDRSFLGNLEAGSWKFDLWWDGSFGGSFFWKFFWKENFFWRNIELKKYWWISNWSTFE